MVVMSILTEIKQAESIEDLLIAENRLTALVMSIMYTIAALLYIILYRYIPIDSLLKVVGIVIFIIMALLGVWVTNNRFAHPLSTIIVSLIVIIPFMYTYFVSTPFVGAFTIVSYWLILLLCGFFRSEYYLTTSLFCCVLIITTDNSNALFDIAKTQLISFIIPEFIIFLLIILLSYTIIFTNRSKSRLLLNRIDTIKLQSRQVGTFSADLEIQNKVLEEQNEEIVKLNDNLDIINKQLSQKNEHLKDQRIQLTQLAYYDPLTHVMKRQTFIDELQAKMQFLKDGESLAILLIDIDNFKSINDTVGDAIGDQIIVELCQRIYQTFGEVRSLGRIGGDCFGLIYKTSSPKDEFIASVLDNKARIDSKLKLHDLDLNFTTSIGMVIYPEYGNHASSILKYAEIALSEAKETGKNKLFVYDAYIQADIRRRNVIVNEFQYALSNGEFSLHFQPIISLNNEHFVGFEALLRWHSRNLGFVSPAEFIPIAEASGAIYDIGHWVIDQTCAHYNIFRTYTTQDFYMSLNLSTYQLLASDFIDQVKATVERHHINPGNIALEITESAFNKFSDPVINTIIELKKMGFLISIDDFGSGFFTFEYFLKLDIDILKIDKSLLDTVLDRTSASSIVVEHMINLFTDMDKHVICEGVEHQEQVDYLRDKACHSLQGYYYSKPLDYDNLIAYIEAHQID